MQSAEECQARSYSECGQCMGGKNCDGVFGATFMCGPLVFVWLWGALCLKVSRGERLGMGQSELGVKLTGAVINRGTAGAVSSFTIS